MATEKTNTLTEQHKAERPYYLGKLSPDDKVPGSDKTMKELRKEHLEAQKAEDDELLTRRAKIASERKETLPLTQGTVVTAAGGTVSEIELPVTQAPLTEDFLSGKTKAELVAEAESRNITVVPDRMTKAEMVDMLLGRTVPPVDETEKSDTGDSGGTT